MFGFAIAAVPMVALPQGLLLAIIVGKVSLEVLL